MTTPLIVDGTVFEVRLNFLFYFQLNLFYNSTKSDIQNFKYMTIMFKYKARIFSYKWNWK